MKSNVSAIFKITSFKVRCYYFTVISKRLPEQNNQVLICIGSGSLCHTDDNQLKIEVKILFDYFLNRYVAPWYNLLDVQGFWLKCSRQKYLQAKKYI